MGEPVKIVLLAETEQAAKALRDFLNTANPGLKQLSVGAKEASGQLGNSRLAMMELGHVGRAMAEGLAAGISPMRMLAMETPRLAQAASMSGISLNTIKTAIAGISPLALGAAGAFAAVAAGAGLIWYAFHSEEQKAIESHNQYVKNLQAMPEVIQHINEAAKAGFLSPETQKQLLVSIGATRAELGKIDLKELLKFQPGPQNLSTNALPNPNQHITLLGMPAKEDLKSANEELAQAGFLLKEIGKDGQATFSVSDKGKALVEIIELRKKLTLESLSGYEKEKAAAKQSYDQQLAELNEYLERANDKLKEGEGDKLRTDLRMAYNHQITDIDFRQREEDEKKAAAAFAEGQRLMGQMVAEENRKLDRDLDASAAKQGKNRQQIYQEEYNQRIDLLTRQLYSGEIDEKQYTEAVQDATTRRLESIKTEEAERRRLHILDLQLAKDEALNKARLVLSDPHSSQNAKSQALFSALATLAALKQQNQINLQGAKTDQERIEFTRERMQLDNEYTSMLRQQQQEEERINEARLQGVKTMFGNMATAAKAFGEKGLAVYKGFAIAEATIDTAKAAIAAYQSVVGIPYVGPILAPIAAAAAIAAGAAQISAIESASAREHGGDADAGQLLMTGERGRELFVPNSSGRVFNADDTARLINLSRTSSGARSHTQSSPKISVSFFSDKEAMNDHARENTDFHHILVDVFRKNVHLVPARASS
jgi:hypothetical protein